MAKKLVTVLGVVFLLIGVLGFFNNPILGMFAVDAVHNIVHLVSGLAALFFASKGEAGAKQYGKIFGIIYALVAVLGFLMPSIVGSIMMSNGSDNVLHLVLAVVLLYVGFAGKNAPAMGPTA